MVSFNLSRKNVRKKLNGQGGVKVQLLTHPPLLLWLFDPHPFFQLSANSSSLVIPLLVLKCNAHAAQTDYFSTMKAEVHALKTNRHVFHLQKRHQSALFSYWSCKQQYLVIRETHQLYCLVYKQKKQPKKNPNPTKNPKQLGILGYFQLSLLPSANVPRVSTQFKARALSL